ncbi:hypothetical protein Btru_004224 [Bulinus truncatus]|nr:hypothetical protein Btru_004224 [Bulinus truncatus]
MSGNTTWPSGLLSSGNTTWPSGLLSSGNTTWPSGLLSSGNTTWPSGLLSSGNTTWPSGLLSCGNTTWPSGLLSSGNTTWPSGLLSSGNTTWPSGYFLQYIGMFLFSYNINFISDIVSFAAEMYQLRIILVMFIAYWTNCKLFYIQAMHDLQLSPSDSVNIEKLKTLSDSRDDFVNIFDEIDQELLRNYNLKKKNFPITLKYLKKLNANSKNFKDEAEYNLFRSKWLKCINSSTSVFSQVRTSTNCVIIDQISANCSGLNLSKVPPDLPASIKTLNLDNNGIRELCENDFGNYPNLLELSIASNCLYTLHENSFYGLSQLKKLILTNNILVYNSYTFPECVFQPLQSLSVLKLNLNNPHVKYSNFSYPDKALSYLKRLKSLHMDGLKNTTFGKGFSYLTQLRDLTMAGYLNGNCHMSSLYNSTFVYLPNLEYLSLQDCYLIGKNIEAGTFEPLRNLAILSLTHNEDIGFENLHKVLYGLRNALKLHTLYLQLINDRYSLGVCLNHKVVEHFPPNLQYLDVQENNLEALDREVIGKLPTSLKVLELSGNKFVLGEYLEDLHKLIQLSELRINGGSYFYNLPTFYPYKSVSPLNYLMSNLSCSIYSSPQNKRKKIKFILQFPPNLTKIDMNEAGLAYKLSYFRVNFNNTVKNISLRGNRFPLLFGPIKGLYRIQHLDISKCQIRNIFSQFFWNFKTLQYLNLSQNYLHFVYKDPKKKFIFSSLKNVQVLDISFNGISVLTQGILDHLVGLKTLNLNFNPLKIFNVNISNMPDLRSLGFRNTRLGSLDDSTIAAIDNLIKQGSNITVDMSYSPILCECSNLKFIQWMKASQAFDPQFHHYVCLYADGSSKFIDDQYEYTLMILTHECASYTIIFFSVSSVTSFLIVIIFIAIIYIFRWKLRYLYYAAYLHYWRNSKRQSTNQTFDFDVFVCYHDDDEDFVLFTLDKELERRHLKTCVHKRDFVLGEPIATNIVRAVTSSRKTLVVLTSDMIKSKWCNFEVQMATMESVSNGRPVLIFLIMSKINSEFLGAELSYCVENNTYVEYPDTNHTMDAAVMDTFWSKLVNDIKN